VKILLIGEFPPPYGGISVHVAGIHKELTAAGIPCRVLDTSRVRDPAKFTAALLRAVRQGWTPHLHTNGHNPKSWLVAFACGLAGRVRRGGVLTLHSGLAPGYLDSASTWRRWNVARTCSLYGRVLCVSPAIQRSLESLGVPRKQTEIAPACLAVNLPHVVLDADLLAWTEEHQPLFSTALFFRPEYGFDLLVTALAKFRIRHPSFGCVVMGSGERQAEALKLVSDAGLESNLLLLGDVEHDTCLALMSRSDVFLRPTLADGDSISVREAVSLGVPVVASRTGTRPAGAILFEPGNVEDMLSKLPWALARGRSAPAPMAGSFPRLLEIYNRGMA
jgi:glycosyltransferase involved in cell wall biosynthesis